MDHITSKACCCSGKTGTQQKAAGKVRKSLRSIPGTLLSVGIAFFPKCPVCWAAYMSLFGTIGLSNIPYMRWLLPVLIVFLAAHLWLVFRKAKKKGYGPFLCSVAGALIIIGSKMFFPDMKALLFTGMALILSGSLWNSFSLGRAERKAERPGLAS